MITDESVKGFTVDTFKEYILLEDTELDFGGVTQLTVAEALSLASLLTRAANKATVYRKA